MGISRTTITNLEKGTQNPSFDDFVKIADFFGVNMDDMVKGNFDKTGKGMVQIAIENVVDKSLKFTDEETKYLSKTKQSAPLVITVDKHDKERITLVDVKAAAGYPELRDKPAYVKDLPTFSLPGHEFQQSTFRCFEVQGDSMERTIHHGDWIIAQYLDNHFDQIREGYIHVVVTRTDVFVKRLLNRVKQRGKIVMQSDNKAYPTVEVNAEDVQEIWLAKRKVSALFINPDHNLQEQVNGLVSDVMELKAYIDELKARK